MSLVYNNGKFIGKCESLSIEKHQGTSPFIMLYNFELKPKELNEMQEEMLKKLKINFHQHERSADWAIYELLTDPDYIDLEIINKDLFIILNTFENWINEQEETK